MQNDDHQPMPDQQPTDARLAQATMKLLERADIKGGEVPMFVQIHNWLQSKSEG